MPRRRNSGRDLHGILLLDKPTGVTSNKVLQQVKRLFKAAKAGHTGSLDPLATGLLPVCFGSGTKISSFLLDANKSYQVTGHLGIATDTGDSDGTQIAEGEPLELESETVQRVLAGFEGDIEQIPPMHSALKHQGRRLYQLAREGVEVERQPRPVHISAITLVRFQWPEVEFTVTCSKGTYVRTLVEDIAKELGTFGHVVKLRRSGVEPFRSEQMVSLETLLESAKDGLAALDAWLVPVDSALVHWPRVVVERVLCERLTHGQSVPADPDWPQGWARMYSPDDRFLGLGEVRARGQLVPRRIFATPTT